MSEIVGELWLRDEPGFEKACFSRVFNQRRPDRTPAAVLRAADADDVAAGVRLARERDWQVCVRSGGHSWAVWSVRDDALLIDLERLTGLAYDESTGIAVAGPAVRGGADLDPFLESHGRFFNGGHCPTVGLGGFLLQGGMGWNCRGWNWAAEHVAGIDVVTADGDRIYCDETQNADLFWAARGSGPGFPGIVTAFHLQTRPRFRRLTQSTFVYPAALAEPVLTWFHTARHSVPGSVELVVVGLTAPLPPEIDHEGPVVVVDGVCFEDDVEDAARALAPLLTCPVLDQALISRVAEPTTMAELRTEQVRANPEGHRYVVDNAYLTGSTADVIPRLAPAFEAQPTVPTFSLWFDLSGAPDRPLPEMALSVQSDLYFAAYVVCADPTEDDVCRDWLETRMTELEPVTVGCYLGDSDFTRRPQRFLSEATFQRLGEIRRERDPKGRFPDYLVAPGARLNHPPKGSE